jgi:hypothetical protein
MLSNTRVSQGAEARVNPAGAGDVKAKKSQEPGADPVDTLMLLLLFAQKT